MLLLWSYWRLELACRLIVRAVVEVALLDLDACVVVWLFGLVVGYLEVALFGDRRFGCFTNLLEFEINLERFLRLSNSLSFRRVSKQIQTS